MEFKMNNVKVGRVVEGTVFQVSDDVCYVDLGTFADGKIYKNGLSLTAIESCKEVVKEGEVLTFKVTKIDHENQSILLSRLDMLRNERAQQFNEEIKNSERFDAKVKKATRGGLVLDYKGIEVFMPMSHIDTKRVENAQEFVGQTMTVKVLEQDERRTVVSRRLVLNEDYKAAKKAEFEALEVGQKLEGTVTKVLDFGAFVKVGANEGLLHRSQISHYRFKNVSDVVKEGDKLTVEVISKEKNKLGLSVKSMEKTPWETFSENNKVGDEVTATVVRKMATGMLLEVEKEVVGIINSKDYSWNPRENLAGEVEVGSSFNVKILSMDVPKKRMSLSKKHLDYNPWADVTVRVNEEVSGTVEDIQSNGALVKVQGVKAFLPIAEISEDRVNQVSDVLKVDDVINALVLDVDARNWKMKLSIKGLAERKERAIFENYKKTEEKVTKQTLGDLFADKFDQFK
jgi:small subunit ribosomal protein S1